jgi:hypothetical protein
MRTLRVLGLILITAALAPADIIAGVGDPPTIVDDYEIMIGPQDDAIPGDPEFMVPINASFAEPIVRINLLMSFDPTVLTPILLAPNIFVQSFTYNLNTPGRIQMTLITDLPPPPDVPPIQGDTTVAWIMFRVYSCYIGYDYLTTIEYIEDPVTPFRDNYIVRDNDDIIMPPALSLTPGSVVIRMPLYGDINLNTYAYEIGDAVTFMNFFMGAPFNRRQYANSDCNRDCVQASISDLVYLLAVITYDSLLSFPHDRILCEKPAANGTPVPAGLLSGMDRRCAVRFETAGEIGGAAFEVDLGEGVAIGDVSPGPDAGELRVFYSIVGKKLRVLLLDLSGQADPAAGSGRLVEILYTGDDAPVLAAADFSDRAGSPVEAKAWLECSVNDGVVAPSGFGMSLSGYPNPFNDAATISFSVPTEGLYEIAIFDILGRKVKALFDGYRPAGPGSVVWDGTDAARATVSSGTYFVRLAGDAGSSVKRISLLK